jgi:hypothetical protein
MTFNLAKQRRKLCLFVSDCSEAETLESCAIETAQVVTLITVGLPSTRDQRRPGPESLRVIDCGVQLDHVSAWNDFVKNRERRWSFRVAHTLALLLLGKCHFNFDFTQTLDQSFHASRTQRLDQFVGGRFVSVCQ